MTRTLPSTGSNNTRPPEKPVRKKKKLLLQIRKEIAINILEREKLRQACGIKTCPRCHGAGWLQGTPTRTCPVCKGTGEQS